MSMMACGYLSLYASTTAALEPQRQLEMIASYLRMYEQCGWFPSFPHLQGALPIMLGNHGAALIADTYMKGYRILIFPLPMKP